MFYHFLGGLRRCFNQQADVRVLLYEVEILGMFRLVLPQHFVEISHPNPLISGCL
jgi:hypothetical protein